MGLQAQEGASQVALRDCTEKAGEGVRVYITKENGSYWGAGFVFPFESPHLHLEA